jgi:hypothetical protein
MKNLFILLSVFIYANLNAQNTDRLNSINVETNFIATLSTSYTRVVPINEKIGATFGGEYMMGIGFGEGSHWIVVDAGILCFGPRHFLETGIQYAFALGYDAENSEEGEDGSSPGLRFAYRLQGNKGLAFRATIDVFFNIDPYIMPALGIGYSF